MAMPQSPPPASSARQSRPAGSPKEGTLLGPFHYPAFAMLWSAMVAANVGLWMQNAGAAWLMTDLNRNPLSVALVQVAAAIPIVLFALPGGALAGAVDRRAMLIAVQTPAAVLVFAFAIMVTLGRVTPAWLLAFAFLAGMAAVVIAPAWQTFVPQLVPRGHEQSAIALNNIGFNLGMVAGPPLAGLALAVLGRPAPFWIAVLSSLTLICAAVWWRPPRETARHLPLERFGAALRAFVRHARRNPYLAATLAHAMVFVVPASAYWALLPLVARNTLGGGPLLYGVLLGAMGVGASMGAMVLGVLLRRFGVDRLGGGCTIGSALALILFGLAPEPYTALASAMIAGFSWIGIMAICNASAQIALPVWVRGRGLSVVAVVIFGGLALGSLLWGQIATLTSVPVALLLAAAFTFFGMLLLWRFRFHPGTSLDLVPSIHWPEPIITRDLEADRGPVMITVEYRVPPENRDVFLVAIFRLAEVRRHDGAFDWGLYEDATRDGRFIETFLVDSWMEHLRQHERVANADRLLQDAINRYQIGGVPRITRTVAVEPDTARS
jgi:MFS family permease